MQIEAQLVWTETSIKVQEFSAEHKFEIQGGDYSSQVVILVCTHLQEESTSL